MILTIKNKYSKMSNQLQEIKKHVIKVQTFAMETNLQCIELKKKMFREKTESKNMKCFWTSQQFGWLDYRV